MRYKRDRLTALTTLSRLVLGFSFALILGAAALAAQSPAAPGGQRTPAPPGAPAVEQLAQQLQAHYDGIRDFTADFSQTYSGGVLRKTTTERGNLQVKKPGRMRWTYTSPEDKLFITD